MILSSLPANSAGHYSEEPHDMVAQALRLPEQGKLDLGLAVASLTQGVCLANKWSLHPASMSVTPVLAQTNQWSIVGDTVSSAHRLPPGLKTQVPRWTPALSASSFPSTPSATQGY